MSPRHVRVGRRQCRLTLRRPLRLRATSDGFAMRTKTSAKRSTLQDAAFIVRRGHPANTYWLS